MARTRWEQPELIAHWHLETRLDIADVGARFIPEAKHFIPHATRLLERR